MRRAIVLTGLMLATLTVQDAAQADWKKLLEQTLGGGGGAASAALSNQDITAGLKEALAKGAQSAVSSLGRSDGFLGNDSVRIPLPEQLQTVDKVLRTLGQERYTDEFVTTMNRAAESAVPEASAILGDAIRRMTVEDAQNILNGPDDAATQYFRKVGEERLTSRFRPIVSEATSKAGVTSSYKQVIDSAGGAASLINADAMDLDGYVTSKALDGLFTMIAVEEKSIRDNPAARTSELLKKVFGAAR